MRIVRGLESYPPDPHQAAVALGVFDGVHLGHQFILKTAVSRARERGLEAVACTFDPHPLDVLQPGRAPLPIAPLAERLELIAATGVDTAVVVAFSPELAAMEAEAFVKDLLLGRLHGREIVVGFNHTFGRGARGDVRLLQSLGRRLGFRAEVVPPLVVDGVQVSSSEIRAALERGEVERARRYLGRPYAVAGQVVHGAGRGHSVGFPTANLAVDRPLLIPDGVYVARAHVDGVSHGAVVNVGGRPTFGDSTRAVEPHLLDFSGDLYGRRVRLEFLGYLRPVRSFSSPEALREQIGRDLAAARARL